MIELPADKGLVLFDGYCHLCSGVVQRILKRDKAAYFRFAPLSSSLAAEIKTHFHIAENVDSIVLIEQGKAYVYADAAMRIGRKLGGVYRLLSVGRLLPRAWRDGIYKWIARHRLKWWGRSESCFLPDESYKERFL